MELGVRHFRLEFLDESPELLVQTVSNYRRLLRREITGTQLWRELKMLNQIGVQLGSKALAKEARDEAMPASVRPAQL